MPAEAPVPAFEFLSAGRIAFGSGALRGAGPAAAALGSRAFVLTGSDPSRAAPLLASLDEAGLAATAYPVGGEPSLELADAALGAARAFGADLVIGFGGGSALDAAKAVAALLANPGPVLDYLEVIGAGKPLSRPSLPCIAIPTTAGTGSEVTKNAVLASRERGLKASLRSPSMLPRLALVDPELCLGCPPAVTAASGMDALAQLLEPFTCNKPNPLVDALCREGLARVASSLETACREGGNLRAREDMSLASLFGGLALANARLGAVHGFAAPLGGAFAAPHGALCAALLAPVTAVNVAALRDRAPDSPALGRYAEAARILGGGEGGRGGEARRFEAEDAAPVLACLAKRLGIAPLAGFGIGSADLGAIVEKAATASSMQGNPIALSPAELRAALAAAL